MQPSDIQNRILISPPETALVVVDHQLAFAPCFDKDEFEAVLEGVACLSESAAMLGIPLIVSLVETNLVKANVSSRVDKHLPGAARFHRTGANPWDHPAFVEAVRTANRPRLLIAGLSAETSLSFTALCGLERGFDVYLVKDACLGYSPESFATTFDRLTQAGAVPVSWRQIMIEWRQNDADIGLLRRVLKVRRSSDHHKSAPRESN